MFLLFTESGLTAPLPDHYSGEMHKGCCYFWDAFIQGTVTMGRDIIKSPPELCDFGLCKHFKHYPVANQANHLSNTQGVKLPSYNLVKSMIFSLHSVYTGTAV